MAGSCSESWSAKGRAGKKILMQFKATQRFLPIAPRKVRLLAEAFRNVQAVSAQQRFELIAKRSAKPLAKLLKSAISNAKHNYGIEENDLILKQFIVNEGPKLKRYRPRAFGRAFQILKRTSHVTVVLETKGLKIDNKKISSDDAEKPLPVLTPQDLKKRQQEKSGASKKPVSREKSGEGSSNAARPGRRGLRGFSKDVFRRKSI